MSKTETLRQSAAASNAIRAERLANQIENLRQAKHASTESLAAAIEPMAQAMAALADESRRTLAEMDRRSQALAAASMKQIAEASRAAETASAQAQRAAESLTRASGSLGWRHYGLALLSGLISAVLVSGLWLWQAPAPRVQVQIATDELAETLRPMIEALRPSRSR